jgi:glycosyltransferase involved in cell wall biosynthesis
LNTVEQIREGRVDGRHIKVKRPLRIGFLTSEYPTENYSGGIGSYVRQMAHSLAELGHSITVLLAVTSGEDVLQDGPVEVHRVALPAFVDRLPEPLARLSSLVFARRLASLAEILSLDVLESPEFGGLTAFLNLVKPQRLQVVVRLHTCSAICRSLSNSSATPMRVQIGCHIQDWLERRAIETADSVTAISQATVDLTKTMLKIRRDDFHVTPNPVNELFFSCRETASASNHPMVLFAGRLEWRKGPDILMRALPALLDHHPSARFCLAGGDTNTAPGGTSGLAYLSSLVPEIARKNIEFTGFLQPDQLLERYRQATVCVFPSRWEGFGLVAAEAMACGKAIVVSDTPGFRELVSEGLTGMFAKREDPVSLGSAINLLLGDSGLRTRLGAAASDDARSRFRGSAVSESILRVYRETMALA